LQAEVTAGRFRADLYFRLAVVPLAVPPLRERREDIAELIDYFFARCGARMQKEPCTLDPSARELLLGYHWPGNVRELEHLITRASVLNCGAPVTADELRHSLLDTPGGGETAGDAVPVGLSLQEMERKLIVATLDHFGGHRAKTAKALGIGIRTLSGKLRQYGYAPRENPLAKAG
jgi:DNA-binding NtrC family response regulator